MNKIIGITLLAFVFAAQSCKKINLFTIQDDRAFGLQTVQYIESNPQEFPVMSPVQYKASYDYLYAMRDALFASGKFEHQNDFEWKLNLIKDDATLNAFCTPGGYIYIYTGLIKYLDDASSLAGVLGHEMAHADRRHSTRQLTEIYGIETLLSFIGGNAQQIAQISAQLIALKFSRNHETEADNFSVQYLCPTRYRADGAASFFEKIGSQGIPEFLSTHPDPGNRVTNIKAKKVELNCSDSNNLTQQEEITSYSQLKNSLN